jgi:WD40 repeat protein
MMKSSVETSSFLAVALENEYFDLRDLVLCFGTCRTWKRVLQVRGFRYGAAWLCATLGRGKDPRDLACRIRELHPWSAARRLDVADQVVRFLLRHEEGIKGQMARAAQEESTSTREADRERRWAQRAYQEPDDSFLSQSIKAMRWIWKGRLIHQRVGKPGYHCCMGLWCESNGEDKCGEAVRISLDGKLLAQCGRVVKDEQGVGVEKFTVVVRDIHRGEQCREMPIHKGKITCLAFSHDSKLLASGGEDEMVHVTDESGAIVYTLQGHAGRVICVAWMPDNSLITTGSHDALVRVWDCHGRAKYSLARHTTQVHLVAATIDGSMLASCSRSRKDRLRTCLILWDMTTCPPESKCTFDVFCTECMAWSPDGTKLAIGYELRPVEIRNRCGERMFVWDGGHINMVGSQCQCWPPGQDEYIPNANCPVKGPCFSTVSAIAFSRDGKTVALCQAGDTKESSVIRALDVENMQEKGFFLDSHAARGAEYMAFLPDGCTLVTVRKELQKRLAAVKVALWDAHDAHAHVIQPWPTSRIISVDLSPDGAMAATCSRRIWPSRAMWMTPPIGPDELLVTLWDTHTGLVKHTLQAQKGRVLKAVFNHDGSMIASSSEDADLCFWANILDSEPEKYHMQLQTPAVLITWSPDGQMLACTGDPRGVLILNKRGERQQMIRPRSDAPTQGALQHHFIMCMCWVTQNNTSSNNPMLAVAFEEHMVGIWDAVTGSLLRSIKCFSDLLQGLCCSEAGLLSCCDVYSSDNDENDSDSEPKNCEVMIWNLNEDRDRFTQRPEYWYVDNVNLCAWMKAMRKSSVRQAQGMDIGRGGRVAAKKEHMAVYDDKTHNVGVVEVVHVDRLEDGDGELQEHTRVLHSRVAEFGATCQVTDISCVGSLIAASCVDGQVN